MLQGLRMCTLNSFFWNKVQLKRQHFVLCVNISKTLSLFVILGLLLWSGFGGPICLQKVKKKKIDLDLDPRSFSVHLVFLWKRPHRYKIQRGMKGSSWRLEAYFFMKCYAANKPVALSACEPRDLIVCVVWRKYLFRMLYALLLNAMVNWPTL